MNGLERCKLLDFETTGVDPLTAKPVEMALLNAEDEKFWTVLINPECDIPAETSAVHHITNEDVAASLKWPMVKDALAEAVTSHGQLFVIVAHNAEYEKGVLGDFIPVLWVCTYKCALRVWPDAPNHKNETLRYHLKLGTDRGRSAHQQTHSALHDCRVTRLILIELLKHATLDQLIEWTDQPAQLPYIPMGKFYGKKWNDPAVDVGYLNWLIGTKDMREDVKHCARTELDRRRKQR